MSSPAINFAQKHDGLLSEVEEFMSGLISSGHRTSPDILDEICKYHLHAGGRRLRARLALASAAALGVDPREAVEWAAACELLHNATLIHDDLQDGDQLRRGRPTVWRRYGSSQAINAGDLLLMIPFRALESAPLSAAKKWALSLCLAEVSSTVVRGQAEELCLKEQLWSTQLRQAYKRVVQDKTSALFVLPVHGSALIAGRNTHEVAEIQRVVGQIGVIFQICDDVLDFLGRKGRAQSGEDIREGKVSSLVVTYLEARDDKSELIQFLLKPRAKVNSPEIIYWKDKFLAADVIGSTRAWVHELSVQARNDLESLNESRLTGVIDQLLDAVIAQID